MTPPLVFNDSEGIGPVIRRDKTRGGVIRRLFFILMLVPALSGCSSTGPEELDRLVKEDPEFRQMIVARDRDHLEIRRIKNELFDRKKVLDQQMEQLRKEYDEVAKAQNIRIEKYQSMIESNRDILRREIDTANERLVSRSKELEGYQKTLSDVKNVLAESKGMHLSSQERQKWQERLLMFSEKIRPLEEEIQELKLQAKLKKQKIGFLK